VWRRERGWVEVREGTRWGGWGGWHKFIAVCVVSSVVVAIDERPELRLARHGFASECVCIVAGYGYDMMTTSLISEASRRLYNWVFLPRTYDVEYLQVNQPSNI